MVYVLTAVILNLFIIGSSTLAAPVAELQTRVVIIGAGAAGLQAADILRRAKIPVLILESDERSGGRLYSRPAADPALGLVLDEGANLINSTDRVALSLLDEFKIPYVRRLRHERESMIYLFQHRLLNQEQTESEIFAGNMDVLKQLAQNQRRRKAGQDVKFLNYLTRVTISEYLQTLGANAQLTTLLRSFFWSEYGKTLENLNGHVLHDYFRVDLKDHQFKLIPYTDEAYLVPGGAGQIAEELARRNASALRLNHRVTAVQDIDPNQVLVTAETPQGPVQVRADYVIYAAPLYRLREIKVRVKGVKPDALEQARAVSYASGVKLHLEFRPGFRELYKFPGILVTDTGEQIWTSSLGQSGDSGLLTVLTGPMPESREAIHERVARILTQLEIVAPGVAKYYVGVERTDAPFSYSGALRPGETNELLINENSGPWITIGEASGGSLQGYLEGALESATRRTLRLLSRDCSALLEKAI